MKSTFLITGGAGFVGSSLALFLRESFPAARITCFDNLKRRGSELNLSRLKASNIHFRHGDVRFVADWNSVPQHDFLIDCAAEPSVMAGLKESPDYLLQTNLGGTLNALEWARIYQTKIIFISTSRVYAIEALKKIPYKISGNRMAWDLNKYQAIGLSANGLAENFSTASACSLYGASKLASEMFLKEYHYAFGVPFVVNRCGLIAGPWQMGKTDQGVIALWMAAHLFNKSLTYIGYDGYQVRDVLAINDLATLVLWQIENFNKINGETFNVGGGQHSSCSLVELTEMCQKISGNTVPLNSESQTRPMDIPIYITDNQKVTQVCAFEPQMSLVELLESTFVWMKSRQEILKPFLG